MVFGITGQKRRELQNDTKTLADLRAMCKMKPILDLILTRQLNYLASLAQLPDDRLEKIVFSTTKNTVRNQYRRQLMAVSDLAPEAVRDTCPRLGDARCGRDEMEQIHEKSGQVVRERRKKKVCKSAQGKHSNSRTEDG